MIYICRKQKIKGEKIMKKNKVYEILFVVLLLIGIMVCTVCDIAISGTYTWSLVPVSAIVFAWVALLPIKRYGKKGIGASLVILNICIITYLYALNNVVKDTKLLFSVGMRMSAVSIIYLICIFGIFKILRKKRFTAMGFSLLLGIPMCIIINVNLSEMFRQPLLDLWDLLAILALFVLSIIAFLFQLNNSRKKKKRRKI